MGPLLVLCGVTATLIAGWRAYATAREAVAPLAHDGDPTRAALDRTRRLPVRPRVRRFARSVAMSVGWLAISMYGLFLAVVGVEGPR